MVDWYYSYITHLNMEFPQVGVCSAKFWIIAFNAAISILNKHWVLGLGFADDRVALIGGTDLHHMMYKRLLLNQKSGVLLVASLLTLPKQKQ